MRLDGTKTSNQLDRLGQFYIQNLKPRVIRPLEGNNKGRKRTHAHAHTQHIQTHTPLVITSENVNRRLSL